MGWPGRGRKRPICLAKRVAKSRPALSTFGRPPPVQPGARLDQSHHPNGGGGEAFEFVLAGALLQSQAEGIILDRCQVPRASPRIERTAKYIPIETPGSPASMRRNVGRLMNARSAMLSVENLRLFRAAAMSTPSLRRAAMVARGVPSTAKLFNGNNPFHYTL